MSKEYYISIGIPSFSDQTDNIINVSTNYRRDLKGAGRFPYEKRHFYSELGFGFRFYPVHKYWIRSATELGVDLKDTLWQIESIKKIYDLLMNTVNGEQEKIHIIFEGEANSLNIPLELMCEKNTLDYTPFVIYHPISRKILIHTNRKGLDYHQDKQLNILLVSSSISGRIADHYLPKINTNEEINFLFDYFKRKGHSVEKLDSPTFNLLCEKLSEKKWHIFHYAGHGAYMEYSGTKSNAIFLKKDNDEKQNVDEIDATKIKWMFSEYAKSLKFIYLNCCEGALQENVASDYLYPDFTGIMHGLIEAKVPSFLAFRWRLNDMVAADFAKHFYKSIFDDNLNLSKAIFSTRKYIQAMHKNQNAWISSVLVT